MSNEYIPGCYPGDAGNRIETAATKRSVAAGENSPSIDWVDALAERWEAEAKLFEQLATEPSVRMLTVSFAMYLREKIAELRAESESAATKQISE